MSKEEYYILLKEAKIQFAAAPARDKKRILEKLTKLKSKIIETQEKNIKQLNQVQDFLDEK